MSEERLLADVELLLPRFLSLFCGSLLGRR